MKKTSYAADNQTSYEFTINFPFLFLCFSWKQTDPLFSGKRNERKLACAKYGLARDLHRVLEE